MTIRSEPVADGSDDWDVAVAMLVKHLPYLTARARTAFGRAAEACNISQPLFPQPLVSFEGELGV